MMSAVGHIITGLIAITAVVIWESGHRKTFNNIISIPSHIGTGARITPNTISSRVCKIGTVSIHIHVLVAGCALQWQ